MQKSAGKYGPDSTAEKDKNVLATRWDVEHM